MPELRLEIPAVDEYRQLRVAAGLSAKTEAAALAGLPHSWCAVCVREQGELIGMGRVVGDGGLFFLVVDIAVAPAWQGRGLGSQIIAALLAELRARGQASAHVALMADGTAWQFYQRFGFTQTAPDALGMHLRL